jgi:hypothetical protein
MRTYIFTKREREIIRSFIEGRLTLKDDAVQVIRSRIKSFSELSSDIELYSRFREAISTIST